jgi:putative adhesin
MNKQATIAKSRFWSGIALSALSLMVASPPARAQSEDRSDKLTVHLSDPSRPGTIKANLLNGGITVNVYDGKDVLIESRVRNQGQWPAPQVELHGGMHRVLGPGSGLTAEEENNDVQINADSVFHTVDLILTVPVHTSLVLRTVNGGNITVNGVDGELDVSSVNGGVTLQNVSGNAIAHTLNGKLAATFAKVNPQKAMAFSSMNGEIDVTLPADLKASLSLHVNQGDVYSDFDVHIERSVGQPAIEGADHHGGTYRVKPYGAVYATINGGGEAIQFSSFNGSIFIRKSSGSH